MMTSLGHNILRTAHLELAPQAGEGEAPSIWSGRVGEAPHSLRGNDDGDDDRDMTTTTVINNLTVDHVRRTLQIVSVVRNAPGAGAASCELELRCWSCGAGAWVFLWFARGLLVAFFSVSA